jgi:hypothetical protein
VVIHWHCEAPDNFLHSAMTPGVLLRRTYGGVHDVGIAPVHWPAHSSATQFVCHSHNPDDASIAQLVESSVPVGREVPLSQAVGCCAERHFPTQEVAPPEVGGLELPRQTMVQRQLPIPGSALHL